MIFPRLLQSVKIARAVKSRFVSTVNINVNSFNLIEVKAKDLHEKSDDFVKLTFFDGHKKEVDASTVKSLKVTSTTDEFKMDCIDPSDLSVVIEIPLASSPESDINVKAGSSKVLIENLQTKDVLVALDSGDILFNNLQGSDIKAETKRGNIATKNKFLIKTCQLISKEGEVSISKSQGDSLKIEAAAIKVGSCYNHDSSFISTREAFLKNVHGTAIVKSNGDLFRLLGMTGSIDAQLDNKEVEVQLSDLYGISKVTSKHSNASVKLGMAEEVMKNTHLKITSDCPIDNLIEDLMVTNRKKKSFEVMRHNGKSKANFTLTVTNAKSLEIREVSWVDFFRSVNI